MSFKLHLIKFLNEEKKLILMEVDSLPLRTTCHKRPLSLLPISGLQYRFDCTQT